jgi:hypothetical protein
MLGHCHFEFIDAGDDEVGIRRLNRQAAYRSPTIHGGCDFVVWDILCTSSMCRVGASRFKEFARLKQP